MDSSFEQTFLPMKRKPVSDLYTVSNSFPSLEFFLIHVFQVARRVVENSKKFRGLARKGKELKGRLKKGFGDDYRITCALSCYSSGEK